jgi:hypothetical protein
LTQSYRTKKKHQQQLGLHEPISPISSLTPGESHNSSRVEATTNESQNGDEPGLSTDLDDDDSDVTFEDESDHSATSDDFDSSADDRTQLDNPSDDEMSLQGHENEKDPTSDDVHTYFGTAGNAFFRSFLINSHFL